MYYILKKFRFMWQQIIGHTYLEHTSQDIYIQNRHTILVGSEMYNIYRRR
jgi:hypothetical protein